MTNEEMDARFLKGIEIEKRAKEIIHSGVKGKAIVAFIDLLGFSSEIVNKWDSADDPLLRLMKLKSFLLLAAEKAGTHKFFDKPFSDEESFEAEGVTLIAEVAYPKVISFSDSFIFILPLESEDPVQVLASILAVTGSVMELWRISIDEGFTIRGGIDYGEIFHNNLDLVGPTLISTYILESKIAKISRVIYSDEIKKMIDQNIDKISPALNEYFLRYIRQDIDKRITINPLIIFGYQDDAVADDTIDKIENIMDQINNHEALNKYYDLLDQLYERNRIIGDRAMFNA